MPVKAFEPRAMKLSVLTAALQQLTPHERRDPDPAQGIPVQGTGREAYRS